MGILELWKEGFPLSEAWYQFSSDELYRKYQRPKLSKELNFGSKMLIDQFPDTSDKPKFRKSLSRLTHLAEFHGHRNAVRTEMKADVLQQLQEKKLCAYGFVVGQNLSAPPIEIPDRFFQSEFFKWEKDIVSAPPHEFTFVRILPRQDTPATLRKSTKRGRPSITNDVIAAMLAIAADKPNITFNPYKKLALIIRQRVHKLFPDKWRPDQPADRTIMRLIPKGLKAISAAKKSQR